MVIKSAQRKDSDTFTCSASNPFGEDKTTVRLVVQGKNICICLKKFVNKYKIFIYIQCVHV